METVEGVTTGVSEGVEVTTSIIQELTHNFVPKFAQSFVDDAIGKAIFVIICLIIAKLVLGVVYHLIDRFKVETTLKKFVRSIVRIVVYFLTALIIADKFGFNISSVVALASVLSAAFALAAQGSLSNLFGGILLLITKPFLVGDYISAGGVDGTVLEIGLLNTLVNTVDNKRVSVPNGSIASTTIVNFSTEGRRRVDLVISASYNNNIDDTKKALLEAVKDTANIVEEPIPPFVRVFNYGESSIEYVVRVWTASANYWDVYFDLLENVKYSFDRNGIEMTYNHMNVHMIND